MEGAKLIRNITLAGAFWTGVCLLVTNAEANVYDSEGSAVSVSPGMNPGTVPQAEISVESGDATADSGNANHGGVQVQNVTVQAQAGAENSNSNTTAVDALAKARQNTESSNNALLLQQLELDRLKAEQHRVNAINKFGDNLNQPPACQGATCQIPAPAPAPCGAGPCVPNQSPLIENNNVIVNDSVIKSSSVEMEDEVSPPSEGDSWSKPTWGIAPIAGMRIYNHSGGYYKADVSNKYVFGGAITAQVHKWFTAEGSFTYGEDKLQGLSNCCNWNESKRTSYDITVGAKIGPRYQYFRPYGAIGIGYLIQKYGFQNGDRTSNNFTGSIGAGADYFLTKSFAVGARADYQGILAGSNEYIGHGQTLDSVYGDQAGRTRIGATATYTF